MRGVRLSTYSRRAILAAAPFLAAGLARADDKKISDDLLYDRVNQRLINDRDLGARQLRVQVEDGVVTVSGFVESDKMQKKVEKVVRKEKGVKDVVNETKIRPWL